MGLLIEFQGLLWQNCYFSKLEYAIGTFTRLSFGHCCCTLDGIQKIPTNLYNPGLWVTTYSELRHPNQHLNSFLCTGLSTTRTPHANKDAKQFCSQELPCAGQVCHTTTVGKTCYITSWCSISGTNDCPAIYRLVIIVMQLQCTLLHVC